MSPNCPVSLEKCLKRASQQFEAQYEVGPSKYFYTSRLSSGTPLLFLGEALNEEEGVPQAFEEEEAAALEDLLGAD